MDNVKYGRNYELSIQKADKSILKITMPFTIEFDIRRNSLTSANICQIRIYNLHPDARAHILKNQRDTSTLKAVKLLAGYGKDLSLGFVGNITQAFSVREGVNMITQIECYDGGYAYSNAITDKAFLKGTPAAQMVKGIAKDLVSSGVAVGAIGKIEGTLVRGASFSGSTTDLMAQVSGGAFFIDNQVCHVLGDKEALDVPVLLINSRAGLLGTPIKEETLVTFDMVFEPTIKVGQLVRLESVTEKSLNTTYKVTGIHHRGTISGAVAGQAITSVTVIPGEFKMIPESV